MSPKGKVSHTPVCLTLEHTAGMPAALVDMSSSLSLQFPFFREKPRDTAIQHNKPCELSCMAVGEPRPIVQWFRSVSLE